VDALAQAVAQLLTTLGGFWSFVLIVSVGSSIGEGLRRGLSGRRANQRLRGELKATKAEVARLHESRSTAVPALAAGQSADPAGVAALAGLARSALADRMHALDLLTQVQATDRAWPQLPQELRDEIDAALLRLRVTPTDA